MDEGEGETEEGHEGVCQMNQREIQAIHDLNIELLDANLEMLRDIKDYCRRNGLPSPVLDNALSYRVRQLLSLVNGINGTPDETLRPRKPNDSDEDLTAPQGARFLSHPPTIPVVRWGNQNSPLLKGRDHP